MSYEVKTGRGEDGGNPGWETGMWAYERTFWVHRGIGPNGEWHLCAAKTFGHRCPICEHRAKMARDPEADEEKLKDLAPKERQLWLPIDLADPEKKTVWEMSYHLFGKQLKKKILAADEEDEYDYFADPEEGKTVRVTFEQSDRGKWVEASDIEFRSRKKQYDPEIVDEMPDLDSLLVETPYDKLKKLFLEAEDAETEEDDDEKEEKPARNRRPAKTEKPEKKEPATAEDAGLEEGDQVDYDDETCEIIRISKDGTSLTLEDSDGKIVKAVGVDEVKKVERKKKEEPEKTKPAKKPAKKEPEEEEDDAPFESDKHGTADGPEDDEWDDWDD